MQGLGQDWKTRDGRTCGDSSRTALRSLDESGASGSRRTHIYYWRKQPIIMEANGGEGSTKAHVACTNMTKRQDDENRRMMDSDMELRRNLHQELSVDLTTEDLLAFCVVLRN
jgi:hypothetical protein